MMAEGIYLHNSRHKEFIRDRWIEFARNIYDKGHDFGILTFPAEEMQDLHLFKEHGFIDWEEVETESPDGTPNYKLIKGKVRCFEKKTSIYNALSQRLIEAKVNNDDFCAFVNSKYTEIMGGRDKTFPVDVINLDFEGRLYTNTKYPFDNTIKCIFEFQKKHKRNFSLFLTWPIVEAQDLIEYKSLLHDIIESNLEDPSAIAFREIFNNDIGSIDRLEYDRKSVIGVTKLVIKKASQNLYALSEKEFYIYGGGERQRMLSLLFNFRYDGRVGRENIIYANDVSNALSNITEVNI